MSESLSDVKQEMEMEMEMDLEKTRSILYDECGGPAAMYDYMAGFGDKYAVLAAGVARGDTMQGIFALDHMQEMAKRDKGREGKPLSLEEIDLIRFDMAKEYLDAREGMNNSRDHYEQLGWQKAQEFHRKVFEKHGLSAKLWTLETPLNMLSYYIDPKSMEYDLSRDVRDELWDGMLNAKDKVEAALIGMTIKTQLDRHLQKASDYLTSKFHDSLGVEPDPFAAEREKLGADSKDVMEWSSINGVSPIKASGALFPDTEKYRSQFSGCDAELPEGMEGSLGKTMQEGLQQGVSGSQQSATSLSQEPAALAMAFRENPKQAGHESPVLAAAAQALDAVGDRFGSSSRVVAAFQHYLARRIEGDKAIPTPQQAVKMVANAIHNRGHGLA